MHRLHQPLKVMTILGTRPEIIRLSCVLPKMDEYFDHVIVYTNQSYDYELSQIFFNDLKLRQPDYTLDVKSTTIGEQIAKILSQSEKVMLKERPDALLILGDTNSALSAIIAKRLKIPIFHMEAGNRCFDENVPEEINRRLVDHISDYNLPYTEHSRRYLTREGIHPGTVYVTGTPLTEVLNHYSGLINDSLILQELKLTPQKYFLASTHREENVDNEDHLRELFASFNGLARAYKLPLIVSLHPRTKARLKAINLKPSPLIRLSKPLGFFDYNKLQQHALCVLSDSGTIQEESAILNFKAIQIRVSSERPEAFDAGSIILTGFNQRTIMNAVNLVISQSRKDEPVPVPPDYLDKNVSTKVVKLITGLAAIRKYHH